MVITRCFRTAHFCGSIRACLRLRRALRCTGTRVGAIPVETEDPGVGRHQQLPSRDMQLHRNVQLPDVVPDRRADECDRGR